MLEARYYKKTSHLKTKCFLCPHECIIREDARGICGVRKNKGGTLYSEIYGHPVAIHTDPVEKKPLYHFHPGKQILSVGTVGCNLKCFYCQNCDISQVTMDGYGKVREVSPSEIARAAEIKTNTIGVAYTYNEPTIYFEYLYDIAREVRNRGMKNVVVTNGFISEAPLRDLLEYVDAFNVDLKAFTDEFYRVHTKSSLQPVLNSIEMIAEAGIHLEITNLIIPDLNEDAEDFQSMIDWIVTTCGKDCPLHLSRYFPRYKADEDVTPLALLKQFRDIATEQLNYVYIGNVQDSDASNTFCKNCHELVIQRQGYFTSTLGLGNDGRCVHCGTVILKDL